MRGRWQDRSTVSDAILLCCIAVCFICSQWPAYSDTESSKALRFAKYNSAAAARANTERHFPRRQVMHDCRNNRHHPCLQRNWLRQRNPCRRSAIRARHRSMYADKTPLRRVRQPQSNRFGVSGQCPRMEIASAFVF